jgi:hypothetical protein
MPDATEKLIEAIRKCPTKSCERISSQTGWQILLKLQGMNNLNV